MGPVSSNNNAVRSRPVMGTVWSNTGRPPQPRHFAPVRRCRRTSHSPRRRVARVPDRGCHQRRSLHTTMVHPVRWGGRQAGDGYKYQPQTPADNGQPAFGEASPSIHPDSTPDNAHTVMPPPASYSKMAQGPLGKGDVRMDSYLWDIPVKGLTQNPPTGVNEHHALAAQHRACMVSGAAPADRKDTFTVGEGVELSHQRPPVFDEPTRQSAHHLRVLLRHIFQSVMPGWSKDEIRTFYMKRAAYDYPFGTHLGAPADYAKTHGDFARRNSSDD